MKLLPISILLVLVSLIQACSSSSETSVPSQKNKTQISLSEEADTPKAPTFIMRGILTVGHETRSFIPCGSNQQYWVDMGTESFSEAMGLSREAYQPMYAEMIGHLEGTSGEGFDHDFSARFVVSGINFITTENTKRCAQPFRSTKAFGNEPYWSMEFSDDKTRYQQFGADERGFSLSSTRLTPTERKYHFGQGQLTITKAMCNDSMSDSIYGWSATFNDKDEEKQGCATLANKDATLKWVNSYVATSTKSTGFSIELKLSSDHTATTTYSYAAGLPIQESGYWQQLNDEQVQVVMMHHQGQRIVAERLFTLQGNQIMAKHEKVNGNVYPIANGGLTLYRDKP